MKYGIELFSMRLQNRLKATMQVTQRNVLLYFMLLNSWVTVTPEHSMQQ